MTQKTNPETLKHLKELLFKNESSEILAYVKGEFSTQLDTYINMAEEVSQMHNTILQLQINDLNRQVAYNEAMKKLNELLNADEKRFGLK